jgi:hypothetical protein
VAGVLIAGGIALFTTAYDKAVTSTAWLTLAAGSISAVVVGAALLWAYTRQTNRYPWTDATKTWKWFYRDALPEGSKFDIGWKSLFTFKKDKARIQSEYKRQLPLFKEKLKSLNLPKVSHEQDVQQLYVLHVNEKYKNIHLSQLRTILSRGIWLIVGAMALGAVYGEFRDWDFSRNHRVEIDESGYTLRVNWHRERDEDGSEAIVSSELKNHANRALALPRWEAFDEHGYPVPIQISCTPEYQAVVGPGESVSSSCVLKPHAQQSIAKLVGKRR